MPRVSGSDEATDTEQCALQRLCDAIIDDDSDSDFADAALPAFAISQPSRAPAQAHNGAGHSKTLSTASSSSDTATARGPPTPANAVVVAAAGRTPPPAPPPIIGGSSCGVLGATPPNDSLRLAASLGVATTPATSAPLLGASIPAALRAAPSTQQPQPHGPATPPPTPPTAFVITSASSPFYNHHHHQGGVGGYATQCGGAAPAQSLPWSPQEPLQPPMAASAPVYYSATPSFGSGYVAPRSGQPFGLACTPPPLFAPTQVAPPTRPERRFTDAELQRFAMLQQQYAAMTGGF